MKAKDLPVATIKVNGVPVTIDHRTLSIREKQRVGAALAKLKNDSPGYEPDGLDDLAATIWVVMARTDPSITFDDVCSSLTLENLVEIEEAEVNSPEG
jgi:exonuclease I